MGVRFSAHHPDGTWSETTIHSSNVVNYYTHAVVVHTSSETIKSEREAYLRYLRGLVANYELAQQDGTILQRGQNIYLGGARIPEGQGAWDFVRNAFDVDTYLLETITAMDTSADLSLWQVAGWAKNEDQAYDIQGRTFKYLNDLGEYQRGVEVVDIEPGELV